jgi:hypothetical protein
METIFRFIVFLRSLSFLASLGERIEVRGSLAILTTLTLALSQRAREIGFPNPNPRFSPVA